MLSAETPVFEAVIVPHRSLTPKGVAGVGCLLLAATGLLLLRLWLWGAWVVMVFSLVEVPLLLVLFAINQRRARARELIMLDALTLTVTRTDASGRSRQETLPAAWLRADLALVNGSSRILLSSHGRRFEVGSFLHESDKQSLFNAMSDALHRAKNPRFDNPQLRENTLLSDCSESPITP